MPIHRHPGSKHPEIEKALRTATKGGPRKGGPAQTQKAAIGGTTRGKGGGRGGDSSGGGKK